ncbi:hypothetical protein [Pseudomonas sp. 31-12]|uniref:hypothetical protein n=1 Tax=Pseudomonas sp. 31-12 TaxID=2201356 RepID=UPI0013A5681B|nr:hypothetical protein [Pseudomonas sp. 31-12]
MKLKFAERTKHIIQLKQLLIERAVQNLPKWRSCSVEGQQDVMYVALNLARTNKKIAVPASQPA